MRAVRRRATFDAFRGPEARRIDGRAGREGASSRGKSGRHPLIRLSFLATIDGTDIDDAEVAFAIGRQFGTAVERNRARRRVKSALRELDAERSLPHGAYLFRPNRSVLHCAYADVQSSVRGLIAGVEADSAAARASVEGES